jgi:hypothetical protein
LIRNKEERNKKIQEQTKKIQEKQEKEEKDKKEKEDKEKKEEKDKKEKEDKEEKEKKKKEKDEEEKVTPTIGFQIFQATMRFIIQQTVCERQTELFLTGLVLYQMRDIERRFGEDRYLFFVLFSFLCYTFLLLPFCAFFGWCGTRGPAFLLYSSLYLYHQLFPALFQLSAAPWLSEKSFVYLLAAQLATFDGARSLFSAFLGCLTGVIYLSQFKRFRFPLPSFCLPFCRFFFPLRPSR